MRFVLASASPRRREILTRLGYDFTVHCSNAPEDDVKGDIGAVVRTLAERKALWVADEEKDALSELLLKTGVFRITDGRLMSREYCGMPHDGEYPLLRYVKRVSMEI